MRKHHVVNSSSVNSFRNNLDIFCSNKEVYYNFIWNGKQMKCASEFISNCITSASYTPNLKIAVYNKLRLGRQSLTVCPFGTVFLSKQTSHNFHDLFDR